MRQILLICTVLILFFGCKKKKENCYRDYSSADISLLVYTSGIDTFLFRSNLGYVDTIMVSNITNSDITDGSDCPDPRNEKYVHFYFVDSVFQNNGVNMIFIRKPYQDASLASLEFFFSGYLTAWGSATNMVINGKNVTVYPISGPGGTHYLSKLYWSKQYGVLRVDHSNGRIWERIDF